MSHRSLEKGIAGGELPAGEAFIKQVLDSGAKSRCPEDRGAEFPARKGPRGKISGAHAGRGDQDTRADESEKAYAMGDLKGSSLCHSAHGIFFKEGLYAEHEIGPSNLPRHHSFLTET